jgi:hypothetical protein
MDRTTRIFLAVIATLLAIIAIELRTTGPQPAYADSSRFDHIQVVGTSLTFKGDTGMLVLDKRNGNAWFIPRGQDMQKTWFKDPVFLIRVPFEKLDEAPAAQ